MRHFGGQCQRALFSEVRILGDAAFKRKPIDHQKMVSVASATACNVRARGQYLQRLMATLGGEVITLLLV